MTREVAQTIDQCFKTVAYLMLNGRSTMFAKAVNVFFIFVSLCIVVPLVCILLVPPLLRFVSELLSFCCRSVDSQCM